MNNFFLKSLIFLLSIFISLFLAELFLKYAFPKQSNCYSYNPQPFIDSRGFSLINSYYPPNSSILHCNRDFSYTYHIDSNGLRVSHPHNGHTLSIGDSFTFGFGVQDLQSYSSLIGSYNAGMWGNTFDSQYKSFLRNIDIFNPTTVIWTIYPPHLISMTDSNWSFNCPGDFIIELPTFFNLYNGNLISIAHNSILNLELYKFFLKAYGFFSIKIDDKFIYFNKNCYETKEIILYDKNLNFTNYSNRIFDTSLFDELSSSYAKFTNIFKNVVKITKSRNIKLIVVLIPSKFYLSSNSTNFKPPYYQGLNFDQNFSNNNIKNILLEAGMSDADILDISKINEFQSDGWKKYYFEHDAHLNKFGNELIADYILKSISSN